MTAPRLKALVWIFRPAASGPEVLLLERPARRGGGEHPVTGKAEEGESPASTAAREAEEETGLTGALHDLAWSHTFTDARKGRVLEEHAFLLEVGRGAEPSLSSEHVGSRWVSARTARGVLTFPAHREALDRALAAWDARRTG